MMKSLMFVNLALPFSLFCSQIAEARSVTTSDYYYGEELFNSESQGDFKEQLHAVLDGAHYPEEMDFDTITESCDNEELRECFRHQPLTYKKAREYLFGYLHLKKANDEYFIQTIYCLQLMDEGDFPANKSLGPMMIPDNNILNAEHSWPQSKFSTAFPEGTQKSDLHHLFPALNHVNSIRGNHPFGTVEFESKEVCENAKLGENSASTEPIFEPPIESKGNIARALFYFSVRYETEIDPLQESELRQWHNLDPIDFEEISRSSEIYNIQKVRNPFIDHPEWVDQVDDF